MGTFDSSDKLTWTDLRSPVYENYYFDTEKPAWSKCITSVKALNSAPDVSLKDILERNTDIIATGWTFRSQQTEPMLHGAWATLSSVVKIFPFNPFYQRPSLFELTK